MPKIPVVSISQDGERTHYPSMKEAAIAIHASPAQIYRAVYYGAICHGMVWKKVEDDDGNI